MLRQLPEMSDPDLLVGLATGDDAAVYRLSDDIALIQTLDFFPPIVDEPYTFGEIAAANALSDIYAMGGRPLLALNIVGFPMDLSKDILGEILKGGASKASEAGVIIAGGHTIDDKEPKYGMAVTGIIRPGFQVTNAGARPGDALVLTKPIGTGIITTAGKQQRVSRDVLDGAIEVMKALNHAPSDAMTEVGVNACVDITGYGLTGHLLGLLRASEVSARISLARVPVLQGARELVEQDIAPGGTRRNLTSVDPFVIWDPPVDDATRLLLSDAQTSGGLLISVASEKRDELLGRLKAAGVTASVEVGEVVEKGSLGDKRILVTD